MAMAHCLVEASQDTEVVLDPVMVVMMHEHHCLYTDQPFQIEKIKMHKKM